MKVVHKIILSNQEVNDSTKTYIEAFPAPKLTLKGDSETGPIFQAGMLDGPKLEVLHKTPKII